MSGDETERAAAEGAVRRISEQVGAWFAPGALARMLGAGGSETERLGIEWLGGGGKRWRPLLTAAVYRALRGALPDAAARAAVAVECFHKASLVHDDIEDADGERYGAPTLHVRAGIPLAINVGDWMVGEGYRLLAGGPFPAEVRGELVRIAVDGLRTLCLGQGDELSFRPGPGGVTEGDALLLYERKTSSAFDVAAQIGAAAAGAGPSARAALSAFTRLFGIAYQIRDDREDFSSSDGPAADRLLARPTLYLAAACGEPPGSEVRLALDAARREPSPGNRSRLREAVRRSGIPDAVSGKFDDYRRRALGALASVEGPPPLRALLGAIARRVFSDSENGASQT